MEGKLKKIVFFLVFIFFINLPAEAEVEIFFTPSMDCENKIISLINTSYNNIDVVVYSINNNNIVMALKNAFDRGVEVRILTDKTQAAGKYSKAFDIYNYGIDLKVHTKHKIEHNKFAIFDGKNVSTGSFNWTNPASLKNSENCVFFLNEKATVAQFQNRFEYLWNINSKEKSDAWIEKKLN